MLPRSHAFHLISARQNEAGLSAAKSACVRFLSSATGDFGGYAGAR